MPENTMSSGKKHQAEAPGLLADYAKEKSYTVDDALRDFKVLPSKTRKGWSRVYSKILGDCVETSTEQLAFFIRWQLIDLLLNGLGLDIAWTADDQTAANHQGWGIWYIDSDPDRPELEGYTKGRFVEDDRGACRFVRKQAQKGDDLAQHALNYLRVRNPREWRMIMEDRV